MTETYIILLIIVALIYFSIIAVYSAGWFYTPLFQPEKKSVCHTKISVVIAARNEAANIQACIESLQQQTYPKEYFEIIIIDDHSEDDTYKIAEAIIGKSENWKIRKLENSNFVSEKSFKKQAITKGIESATGELIITLDADCVAPQKWLETLANYYETFQPKMIVMPVRFETQKSGLNVFQQMDLSGLIGITAGSLFWNFPVMANGANLAYERKAFEFVNGFKGNENMPGGDDIMLLLKIKKHFAEKVLFLKNENATVATNAATTFKDFFNQRLRWISKSGKFGDWKITAVLLLSYSFNVITLVGLLLGNIKIFAVALAIIMLKWFAEFYLVRSVAKFLKHPFGIFNYVWCNAAHHLYVVVFGVLGILLNYEWKGRKY